MKDRFHFLRIFLIFILNLSVVNPFVIYGESVESSSSNNQNVIIQGIFDLNFEYFVFQGLESLHYEKHYPYFSNSDYSAATSPLRRLSPSLTEANDILSGLYWSTSHRNLVFLHRAVLNKFTVTVFPPGIVVNGPRNDNALPWTGNLDFRSAHLNNMSEYITRFPYPPSYYGSMMVRHIIGSNENFLFSCFIRIRFQGRAFFYLDGVIIGIENSVLEDAEELFISGERYTFDKREARMLDAYGVSLIINSVELTECYNNSGGVYMLEDPSIFTAALIDEVGMNVTEIKTDDSNCTELNPDCTKCTRHKCFDCYNSYINFQGSCQRQDTNMVPFTREEFPYGIVMNNTLKDRYFLRNITLSTDYFEAILFTFGQYRPVNFAIAFHSGAGGPFAKTMFPIKLNQPITTFRMTNETIKIMAKPVEDDPVSLFIVWFEEGDFDTQFSTYQYQSFSEKPTPSDIIFKELSPYNSNLIPSNWYVVVLYYIPGVTGSKIYFQVGTNTSVETYINGELYITTPEVGIATGNIEPAPADLYIVIHIFHLFSGNLIVEVPNSMDLDHYARGYNGWPEFLVEYQLCAEGLIFNNKTFKCVQKCPIGYYELNKKCVYPCVEFPPSNYSHLHCRPQYFLSGPAISDKTAGEDILNINRVGNFEKTYFAMRSLNSLKTFAILPMMSNSFIFYASSLRKLKVNLSQQRLTTQLAPIGLSTSEDYRIDIVVARKGGWLVLTSSLNNMVIGPKFDPYGLYSWNGLRAFAVEEFVYGDDLNTIPFTPYDHGSVIGVRIIGLAASNLNDQLSCKMRFRYNGILYIYLQSKVVGITPIIALEDEGIFITERSLPFNKKDFQVLHVFTTWTDILEMSLIECTAIPSNEFITYEPELEIYSPEIPEWDKVDYYLGSINATLTSPANCNQFYDHTRYCHDCERNNDFSTGDCVIATYKVYNENMEIDDEGEVLNDIIISLEANQSLEIKNIVDTRKMAYVSWSSNLSNFSIHNYFTSGANNSIYFPDCTLPPGRKYYYLVESFYPTNTTQFNQSSFIIDAKPQNIEVIIISENRHSYMQDLLVRGHIKSRCPIVEVQYKWECYLSPPIEMLRATCANPGGIFGSNSTESLIIPQSSFELNETIFIKLTVTTPDFSNSVEKIISMVNTSGLDLDLICSNCQAKYSGNYDLEFDVMFNSTVTLDSLKYTWKLSPGLLSYNFRTFLKVFSQVLPIESALLVEIIISNSSYRGYDSLMIPLNRPPSGGTIDITPKFGYSLDTHFNIWCSLWKDDDIPLSYQFVMSYNEEFDSIIQLSNEQEIPSVNTLIAARPPVSPVYVKAIVKDSFKSQTEASLQIEVESKSENLSEAVNSATEMLESLISSNSTDEEKIQIISLISEELFNFEDLAYDSSKNPCPKCGNHGACNNLEICLCEKDWTLPDCTISKKDFEKLIDLKLELLEQLEQSYLDLNDPSLKETLIKNLEDLTNPPFNTNQTLSLIKTILDDYIGLDNIETTMSKDEALSIAQILSDMMEFAGHFDCKGETNFAKELAANISQYLDTISKNTLNSQLPNEDPNIIETNVFDILTVKGTQCFFSEAPLGIDDNTPTITLFPKNNDTIDCDTIFNLQFYAIQDDLFNCSVPPHEKSNTKSSVAIKIQHSETGENAAALFFMEMIMPKGKSCPKDCTSENGKCVCEDLSVFDPKEQFTNIIENSNLELITKVDSLLKWKFWSSFAFWALLFLTFFYIFTLDVLSKSGIARACVVKELKKKKFPTRLDVFRASFLVTHRLFNIFSYDNPAISKKKRATLYYLRLLIMLAFASIFKTKKSGGSVINPYVLIFPYFTVVPIISFLQWLVIDPLPKKKKTKQIVIDPLPRSKMQQKTLPQITPSKSNSKAKMIRKAFACILVSLSILGSFFIIFVIDANIENDEKAVWRATFLFIIGQDFLVTPLIFLIVQYFFIKITTSTRFKLSHSKVVNFVDDKLIDQNLSFITIKGSRLPYEIKTRNLENSHSTAMAENKEISSLATLNNESLNSINSLSQIDEEDQESDQVTQIDVKNEPPINLKDQSGLTETPLTLHESEVIWNPINLMSRMLKMSAPNVLPPTSKLDSLNNQSPLNTNLTPEGVDILMNQNISISSNTKYSPNFLTQKMRAVAKSPFLNNFAQKKKD